MQEQQLIPMHELCNYHNVEIAFIESLEEYGLIQFTVIEQQRFLPASQLSELEKMIRMHDDLQVNVAGIDVIQHLLRKLEAAHSDICRLKRAIRFHGEPGQEDGGTNIVP
jgi:hypothetical protein